MNLLSLFILYAIALSIGLAWRGYRAGTLPSHSTNPQRPSRILIVGATGGTGRQLLMQALERGFKVTALVRNPSRLHINHPHLTLVQGDVLNPAQIETAVKGQEAVLCALGHKRYVYPTRTLSQGTRNILQAMENQGVKRFIGITSLGLGDSAGQLGLYYTLFVIPVILPFYFWDKARQETIIANSKLDWIIVRPGMLTNGAKRGRFRHHLHAGSYIWSLSVPRTDVAAFMLDQLESNTCLRTATAVT